MGGHGGLNILPQKSWNVYGRENRLKVARDEAKHAEAEKVRQEKQQQVESEHRRQRLLNRAQERGSGVKGLALHVPTLAQPEVPAEPRQQLAHFSLFEEEAAASGEHPENLEEKRQETQRRGNKDTQTSDARFDASFRFANTLGRSSQPWYSQPASVLLEAPVPEDTADTRGPPEQPLEIAPAKAEDKVKSKHKHRHKLKMKSSKHRKSSNIQAHDGKASMLEQLRKERQHREAHERERQQQLVRNMQPSDASSKRRKKYHSAFDH